MNNCKKCNQTIENCECHIPNEVKHKSFISFIKDMMNGRVDMYRPRYCKSCDTYVGIDINPGCDDINKSGCIKYVDNI